MSSPAAQAVVDDQREATPRKVVAKTGQKHRVIKTEVKTRRGTYTVISLFAPGVSQAVLKKADFVAALRDATTMDLVNIERTGVPSELLVSLSKRLELPVDDLLRITGAPRSTTRRKVSTGERLSGAVGQAALGVTRLLAKAHEMLAESTHPDAANFDVERWLGQWIKIPQPALGGRKPEDLLDTPTGLEAVMRVMGAIQSGVSV